MLLAFLAQCRLGLLEEKSIKKKKKNFSIN